jgi:hypothetical protein
MRPSGFDVSAFVKALLEELAGIEEVQSVSVHAEGPTVNCRAFLNEGKFLSFYFNQVTDTQAFALIDGNLRIWGFDYDNLRGWHLHPVENPDHHQPIEEQTITEIVDKFKHVIQ